MAAAARVAGALDELTQQHAAEIEDAVLAHTGAIGQLQGQATAALAVALAQQGQQHAAAVQVAAAAHEAGALVELVQRRAAEMEGAGLAHTGAIGQLQGQASAALAGAFSQQAQQHMVVQGAGIVQQ
ncbi:hypothetical protein FOA52_002866 [Chlamydomonas sp. UWO 241]|nr:hypothetical protein FOA52_002866 [Chlamydomonas sp. UWO 241]